MKFISAGITDIGTSKHTNQDSMLIKVAQTKNQKQIALGIICDGMGGLEEGEVASATVIRNFEHWFHNELPKVVNNIELERIGSEWIKMLKELNYKIMQYGKNKRINLGTTFSGILLVDHKYLIVHVGDSRIYKLENSLELLTEDQTFVQREINRGNMTPEEAERDSRKNILLQCVGASVEVNPEIRIGEFKENTVFMLCSDGFRHVLSEDEMYMYLNPNILLDKNTMEYNSRQLIEMVKNRNEKDNITVGIIKSVL
ncbi:MAG: PP2C family protein-serine/threonine phosphatase [Eubacterium sp.]